MYNSSFSFVPRGWGLCTERLFSKGECLVYKFGVCLSFSTPPLFTYCIWTIQMNNKIERREIFMDYFDIYDDAYDEFFVDDFCSCPYCGMPTESSNPDVLCSDCRETFGHVFYSEL